MVRVRREQNLANQLGIFMRQYARKRRHGGMDPNDRRYDRKLEKKIKHMKAAELDRLLNEPELI